MNLFCKIDLKDFSFCLFSYDIRVIVVSQNNMYLSTALGDILEI